MNNDNVYEIMDDMGRAVVRVLQANYDINMKDGGGSVKDMVDVASCLNKLSSLRDIDMLPLSDYAHKFLPKFKKYIDNPLAKDKEYVKECKQMFKNISKTFKYYA